MLYASPLAVRRSPDSISAALFEAAALRPFDPTDAARVVELGLWLCDALAAVNTRDFSAPRELTEQSASYLSPERACGLSCDVRSDLYSIGCMLFEVAEGRPPFVGSVDNIVLNHVMVLPPPVRAVPRPIAAVIERLLAKEPADRYQTVEELRQALQTAGVMAAGCEGTLTSAA